MDIAEWWASLTEMRGQELALTILQALIIIVIGFVLARLASLGLKRLLKETSSPHITTLVQRAAFYLVFSLTIISALHQLGFNFGVLLGAAGILTIAVGFASQTSMSNLISGLFLIGERPFEIGDLIKIDNTVGEVLSIDLLSVKLRMFDNTYVRIPNEAIIKTQVSTLTKFPIRRIDLLFRVGYQEDMARVRQILFDVAVQNPLCLEEPAPLFIIQGFGDSGVDIQFSVWVRREEYLALKNSIQLDIKTAFDQAGVEFPFPQRTLHPGRPGEPFPVTLVAPETGAEAS